MSDINEPIARLRSWLEYVNWDEPSPVALDVAAVLDAIDGGEWEERDEMWAESSGEWITSTERRFCGPWKPVDTMSGGATEGRVLVRPHWWNRQWIHGYLLGRRGSRWLVRYGVDSDLFGSWDEVRAVPSHRITRLTGGT